MSANNFRPHQLFTETHGYDKINDERKKIIEYVKNVCLIALHFRSFMSFFFEIMMKYTI